MVTLDDLRARLKHVRSKPYGGNPGLVAHCPVCQLSSPPTSSGHLLAWSEHDGNARLKCTINQCDSGRILDALGVSDALGAWHAKQVPDFTWDYVDVQGRYLFTKAKWIHPKRFLQGIRRADGGFSWKLEGVPKDKPFYRLPELMSAIEGGYTVHLCEGEKAVDRLFLAGAVATCQSDGAGRGKLRDHHVGVLSKAKEVVIWADRDQPGIEYARECRDKLTQVGVPSRVVQSATLGEHDDAWDHLEAGFDVSDGVALADSFDASSLLCGSWGRFLTVGELLRNTASEPEWLWEGVLVVGGVCLLCAKPKVGKSTFLRQLALCVARGEPFLGRPTKQGKVIYLAIEESPNTFGPECLRVGWAEGDPIHLRIGSAPLEENRKIIGELRAFAAEGGYALLVVDTIGKLARVRSGNDYAEVCASLEPLIDLARETGCAVVMTHHLGKNERETGDGSLGSTAYFGAVDVCLEIKKVDGNRVIGSVGRYGSPFERQVLAFEAETRRLSLGCSLEALQAKDASDELVGLVAANGPLTRDSLKELAPMSGRAFNDALTACKMDGRIVVRSGSGKKGDPHLLAVPESRDQGDSDSGFGFSPIGAECETESSMRPEQREVPEHVHTKEELDGERSIE